ncbi:unnamed protein product [Phaedon cochleariae]|uniref:Guanine nucleotide-binding protein G(s) subunit alpha n=1 Tax=Phaedon cochleariae TaxID=80249 RepID=A0A9P0DKI0_PHACE|nr:unnamed protein product [Phaedon cochleariae]
MGCKSKKKEDKDHELYSKKFMGTQKLLLLGTGESGKSTIIKQMKILHVNGFSESEKKEKIPNIRQNIRESIYDILSHMNTINPPEQLEKEESKTAVEYILQLGPKEPIEYTDEYFDQVDIAWRDEGVKKTFRRSNEYQLIDSAEYFLDRLHIIRKTDYIPTVEDILYCRVKTVSISKIEFEVQVPKSFGGGMAEFWMYDVGGQRGERKKWIKIFSGIETILFLIAASDFDLTLREDNKINRLQESFNLFEDIYWNQFVRDAGLIVFLNKQDVLKRKIQQGGNMTEYFPEYSDYVPKESCENEYDKAKLFMKHKIEFTELCCPINSPNSKARIPSGWRTGKHIDKCKCHGTLLLKDI